MRVLVTGGAGYIGSVMVPMLLEDGYEVIVLDRFFFGRETLRDVEGHPGLTLVKDDIRWFDPSIMRGVDAVIDLAALSNDPSGELDPERTMEINYKGRVRVAQLAKKYGVEKYIFASTCSVYGFQDGIVNEDSPTNPLTTYAKSAVLAERDIMPLRDNKFSATFLRQATVYGLSPRMRFDLVINAMVLYLWKDGKLRIMRDGTQWRPFVHVRDTSRAFIKVLESDSELVNGRIFNVGSNEQNYQIFPLAQMLADALGMELQYEWYGDPDKRSYRVDFSKINEVLGFKPKYTPKDAAKEIYSALEDGKIKDDIKTRTVQWYKYLLEAHKIIREVELNGRIL
ncbi:SDR family oxidoreductase [Thermococcus sp. 21S7]|uniref:NAD-dependent epimerase/dehydratase family protein n=1 Tax=Thermococcus sp. 21S7 TaxID=1638221 RepID=UPI00143BD896|nr:SDR family oxidoreductase [Thermococcus sp. 21S7]NJE62111.1 NAD-dependent epimerase/dehydratase family protein [Thermococcus sp. 21S7]